MKYRLTTLLPTEMFVEANSPDEAKDSIEWLLDQYPTVDAPLSDKSESRMDIRPRIMTVEETNEDEFDQQKAS